jgi:hypothetical protein
MCTRWALRQLPLVAEQRIEVGVVPGGRRRRPRAFQAAGRRMAGNPALVAVLPPEPQRLDRGAFRLGADELRVAGTMRLAERVATGDERNGLLVVHRHALERFADVLRGAERIRCAVRPFRIHVDEPHLHRGQRRLEHELLRVARVAEPFLLNAPVDVLLGLESVLASAAEAERLQSHRLDRGVAGENHEVGPRELLAILRLDRPEQPSRLVEIAVVRPAVEGCEALRARRRTAASVRRAIGARAVPRHANEQRAVVSPVGWPPRLGPRHELLQVSHHHTQVELLELDGIVECCAERVGGGRVLVKHREIELVGPPVPVRAGPARWSDRVHDGALCPGFNRMTFHL